MRKYVVGILVGFLLASAFPVSAAVSSLVGKKITNEYTITVDGKDIGVKAIVVDGVSYTPNRAIVGAMGGDIKFKDKTVIVSTDKSEKTGGSSVENSSKASELQAIEDQLNELNKQVTQMSGRMKDLMFNIGSGRGNIEEQTEELDQLKVQAEELKSQIADLERQKSALEAQN